MNDNSAAVMLEGYQRGRHEGMIEAMKAKCKQCEDGKPVEYVGQLNKWMHRWDGGEVFDCLSDPIRKLLASEGWKE